MQYCSGCKAEGDKCPNDCRDEDGGPAVIKVGFLPKAFTRRQCLMCGAHQKVGEKCTQCKPKDKCTHFPCGECKGETQIQIVQKWKTPTKTCAHCKREYPYNFNEMGPCPCSPIMSWVINPTPDIPPNTFEALAGLATEGYF